MKNARNISQTRRLIRHGLMVIFVGLLCGFGLGFAINGEVGFSPIPITFDYTMAAEPRAWRSAHVGAITNGMMSLLFAAVLPFLALQSRAAQKVVTGTIIVIWGNTIFYVAALWAPNRGLSFGATDAGPGNLAGAVAYIPAVIAAVLLLWIVAYLIIKIPRSEEL
ncbi:hypothetical protein GN278_01435 [Rhodobacteraceae bacterium Araon29]